jgi:hypothetical protein
MAETKTVRFISQEGDQFDVSLEVAQVSELIMTLIDGEFSFCLSLFVLLTFLEILKIMRFKKFLFEMSEHIS